jgi:hypothetical protein
MRRSNEAAVRRAALQGFDDGFFRNDEEQYHFATEAERAAYDAEFAVGRKQRSAADKRKAKR